MTVTSILQGQAGIQYGSVSDKSEADPRDSLVNALFTGEFKRGRFDAPFKVTLENIRAVLGYEPDNMIYMAIEDALADGAPFVWVMRVSSSNGSMSVGISPDLQYQDDRTERNIYWAIEVNGELYPEGIASGGDGYSYLEDYLQENEKTLGITGEYIGNDGSSVVYMRNITNTRKFVRLIPDKPYTSNMTFIGNPTAKIDSEGVISVWLEANNEVIEPEPEPEPEICNCEQSWVLIPEITPDVTLGYYDELVMGIENVVQSTKISHQAGTPVIDLIIEALPSDYYKDRLELIRCDGEGTLLRNKTNYCLNFGIMTLTKNSSGFKEPTIYLSGKDLCAYDASEVIPEPIPTDWDIKYKVNGQWIYETTGPVVEQSDIRNSSYRDSATELVISDSVTEISYGAFPYWVNLTKLTLSQNLKTIQQSAFTSLKKLTEIIIPDSVEFIGFEAFRYAYKVKKIVLGTGVKTIKSYAFAESHILDALIMTGLTPPAIMEHPWFVMDSGSNGYTTGVIFVPDEAYDTYAQQVERLRRLSGLSTYDFTKPYHWIY